MVQTVTQKQCTESKTGLGAPGAHPEPKLRAHCAGTEPRTRAGPCCGAHWRHVVAVGCAPLRCPALLCHDTISCIVTQHQTWAVAHPVAKNCFFFIFFYFFIFLFISAIGKPPNIYIYIYIYIFFFFHFPVNQINLKKFIFFQFYTL